MKKKMAKTYNDSSSSHVVVEKEQQRFLMVIANAWRDGPLDGQPNSPRQISAQAQTVRDQSHRQKHLLVARVLHGATFL